MNITKFTMEIEHGLNILVKEKTVHYPAQPFTSPKAIVDMLNQIFHLYKKSEEYGYMIAFNPELYPLGIFEISHGCITHTIMNTREIYIRALLCNATSIIIIHNHPTGSCFPSDADDNVSMDIFNAGKLIGIPCLDHIIISSEDYYSYKENKKIF